MTRLSRIPLTLCALAALIVPALAATSRMPYGSYLTRPVSDAHDFARLLRQDRVVAQRFADHFGINNDALADYVEEHGQVVMIPRSGYYVEYFIDRNGNAHKHHKRLGPKHRVLFVRGTPLLDMECGNPMTKTLPPAPRPRVAQAPPPRIERPRPPVAPPPPPPVQPPSEAAAPPEVEITEQPPAAPAPPPAEIIPPSEAAPPPAQAPPPPGGRRPSLLLPLLIGAGALIIDDDDGGGGEAPPPPPPPPGPVIPESSTLALGLSGMGFIVTLYRRRRGR